MAIDKTIIPPSEATEVAQAGHDYVNGILPLSNIFPVKSNEGSWITSWTPVIPKSKTRAMKHRAYQVRDIDCGNPFRSDSAVRHGPYFRT